MSVNLPRLIDLLRSTLERVEQSEESPDRQEAVLKLRRSVVLTLAERERLRASEAGEAAEAPDTEDSAA